jgi:hypothetical protein
MRNLARGAAALFLAAGTGAVAAPTTAQAVHTLSGEYVEARTCNVYTGACHANGEMVTAGREALLAWQIKQGTVEGVKLDGLNAVAVVVSADNLGQDRTDRRTVLYVDSRATGPQSKALVGALTRQYGKALGEVVAVKTSPIAFSHSGLEYTVRVPDTAYLRTTRYARDCCIMPHSIWYAPFISLKSSMVAKTALSEYKGDPQLSMSWRRADENSSFVGEFAF